MVSSLPKSLGTHSSDFWVFCISPSPRPCLTMSQESGRGKRPPRKTNPSRPEVGGAGG